MKTISGTALRLTAALLTISLPALAHHGDAGRFEENTITLTGTVIALQLVNPHASILLQVEDDSGATTTWQAELGSPRQLATRFGWTRTTLQPGTRISVTGRPLKSGAPYINLTERARIALSDTCEEIYHSTTLPDEPLACETTGS